MALSLAERDRRYVEIRKLMSANEIGCLLVAGRGDHVSRGNIRYITDNGIICREQYCILPPEGSALTITTQQTQIAANVEIKEEWVSEFLITPNDPAAAAKHVAESLLKYAKGGKVGIVGMQDISVPVYEAVRSHIGERLVDATWIFNQVREIKSAEEIESVRKSTAAADKAYSLIRDIAKPGLSDYEVWGEVDRSLAISGCCYAMNLIDFTGETMNLALPWGEKMKAGSTFALELIPAYDGYYTEIPAMLPVSEDYPEKIAKMVEVWKLANREAQSALKPGSTIADINAAIQGVVKEHGYYYPWRSGHGVGLDCVEGFNLNDKRQMSFKPGMVFTLHPGVYEPNNPTGPGFAMGYTYLLTESGCERLNKFVAVPE